MNKEGDIKLFRPFDESWPGGILWSRFPDAVFNMSTDIGIRIKDNDVYYEAYDFLRNLQSKEDKMKSYQRLKKSFKDLPNVSADSSQIYNQIDINALEKEVADLHEKLSQRISGDQQFYYAYDYIEFQFDSMLTVIFGNHYDDVSALSRASIRSSLFKLVDMTLVHFDVNRD